MAGFGSGVDFPGFREGCLSVNVTQDMMAVFSVHVLLGK